MGRIDRSIISNRYEMVFTVQNGLSFHCTKGVWDDCVHNSVLASSIGKGYLPTEWIGSSHHTISYKGRRFLGRSLRVNKG